MRTTVNIDDHLLAWAKELAQQRGKTLGDVVEEALQRLALTPSPVDSSPLPVFEGEDLGLMPGIDPRSNASFYEAMDERGDTAR